MGVTKEQVFFKLKDWNHYSLINVWTKFEHLKLLTTLGASASLKDG